MTGYQPFVIAPFKTGLDTDLEPWLAPVDAFIDIENGHVHHGFLEKRSGYRFMAQLVHGRVITAASNATPAVFQVSSATGLADGQTVSLNYLESSAGVDWAALNNAQYTIDGLSGTSFNLLDSTGTAVNGMSYGTYLANSGRLGSYEGERVMGIFRYITADNIRDTLAADTKRVCIYNTTSNLFQPLDLIDAALATKYSDVDHFDGSNTDYIWVANWQNSGNVNRVYITNGKAYDPGTPGTDGILYYDAVERLTSPTTPNVVQFQPSLSNGSTLDLYGSRLIFSIKQRLVCLYTYENDGSTTTNHAQRARWCAAQDPSNWEQDVAGGGGFVDAPTGEQIISARQLQDVLIVLFTDSVWTLRPVSDPAFPFRWDRINDFRACDGKMASVGFDRYVFAIGLRGITATDGVETRRVDDRIEDFVDQEVSDDQFKKVFALRSYDNRRTWVLYPSDVSDEADKALIYDDESAAYSKYSIALNVLGYGINGADYAAQDFTVSNDLDLAAKDFGDETASSFFWSSGTELFLGGDRSGNVYVLETGLTDDGTLIPFEMTSAAWNPWKEEAVEAQFGYVDFQMNADQDTRFVVQFFKDNDEFPYSEQGINCLPNLTYLSSIGNVSIDSDPTVGFTVLSNGHGLSQGDPVYFYGVRGAKWLNNIQWTVGATVTENSFSVDTDITSYGSAITGATQANPCVITSADHGFKNGDVIYIVDVAGMVELNDLSYTVQNVTTNTYELSSINSSGFTAYSSGGYAFHAYLSGGEIVKRKFYRTKVKKRAYAGAYGYQHKIKLIEEPSDNPLRIDSITPWMRKRGRRALG